MSKAYGIISKEPLNFLIQFSVSYQYNHYFYIRYDEKLDDRLLNQIYTTDNIYFKTFKLQNKQGDDFIIESLFKHHIKNNALFLK